LFFGLEHQPSPRGWVESSHNKVLFWAGPGPISFWVDFDQASLVGRVGPVQKKYIFKKSFLEKIVIFPRIFLRHVD